MKTTIILCTLVILFNGTLTRFGNEEVKPRIEQYKQEFKKWL